MDVNGFKGPNSEARNGKQYDIRSFKVARFSTGCAGVEVNGIGCVYQLPSYSPIKAGSEDMDKWDPEWNSNNCKLWDGRMCKTEDNYWAGAKKACDDIGMSLANGSKLHKIYDAANKDPSLGLPSSSSLGWFWSSEGGGKPDSGSVVYFASSSSNWTGSKYDSSYKVLCVGD